MLNADKVIARFPQMHGHVLAVYAAATPGEWPDAVVAAARQEVARREAEREAENWKIKTIDGLTVRRGWKTFGNGETWYAWVLISAPVEEERALALAGMAGMDVTYHYRGPGLAFHNAAYVQFSRTRTLVRQYGGLDI